MFSSNRERLSLGASMDSSLVRVGMDAYSGRDMRTCGDDNGDTGRWGYVDSMVRGQHQKSTFYNAANQSIAWSKLVSQW